MRAFVQLWALGQVQDLIRGNLAARGPLDWAQVALCLGTARFPASRLLRVVAFGARAVCVLRRFPVVWDAEVLALIQGLAVVAHAVLGGGEEDEAAAVGTTRWMLAIFYWFAGFWKVNTSFLNPRSSCAAVYFVQLLDAYAPAAWVTARGARVAAALAPYATVAVECGVGACFFAAALKPFRYASAARRAALPAQGDAGAPPQSSPPPPPPGMTFVRRHHRVGRGATFLTPAVGGASRPAVAGVVLAVLLHLGIAATPPPNNIAGFSVVVAPLLAFFVSDGARKAVDEALGTSSKVVVAAPPLAVHVLVGAVIFGGTVYRQVGWPAARAQARAATAVDFFDWGVLIYAIQASILCRALMLDGPATREDNNELLKKRKKNNSPMFCSFQGRRRGAHRAVTFAAAAATLVWCLSPMLGLLDIASPNMFSNLNQQGPSNHLLLPTSLLQRRSERADPRASVFAGGVVRVDATNSSYLRANFPVELNSVLTPRARRLLQAVGHRGIWNSAVARVVGSWAVPTPDPDATLAKFTLPAYEFRCALANALRADGAFHLAYTQFFVAALPESLLATNQYRINANQALHQHRAVRLVASLGAVASCTADAADATTAPCSESDLALAPIPPRDWAARPLEAALGYAQAWNSYPLPNDAQDSDKYDNDIDCYGS